MPSSATKNPVPARQRILDTAHRLFYRDGFRATGIDRIIAESGVAKMSFYRHFPAKSDLIEAFLQQRHETWMTWFEREVESRLSRSGAGLEIIADVLKQWFRQDDFRGCAFINTVAESGSTAIAATQVALAHKAALTIYVTDLARRLKLRRPQQVAEAAMIVIDGSIVRAQMNGDAEVSKTCRRLLLQIGAAAQRPTPHHADFKS